MNVRPFWLLYALLGIIGLLIAASVSHVFPPEVRPFMNTANKMHFVHLIPLAIILIFLEKEPKNKLLLASLGLFLLGYLLFPFAIYCKHIFHIISASALAPYGGYIWMLAWVLLGIGMYKRK